MAKKKDPQEQPEQPARTPDPKTVAITAVVAFGVTGPHAVEAKQGQTIEVPPALASRLVKKGVARRA